MRADRLLAIMLVLRSQGRTTAAALAVELEVSERTIYRDIDALCMAGIPVCSETGPGGGFSLPANYRVIVRRRPGGKPMSTPYDQMTDEELQALTERALDEHEAGTARFRPRGDTALRTSGTVPISLRMPVPLLENVKAVAAARGMPYQRLIKVWLEDALARHAPDTLPEPVTVRLTHEAVMRLRESGSIDIHLEAIEQSHDV